MRSVLRRIDRAIKRLYNLEFRPPVEQFLVSLPDSKRPGVLLLAQYPEQDSLELGIHLSPIIRGSLTTFPKGQWVEWTTEKLQAFTVVTEEISHFHYVRYHATQGRQVSHLELEMQGEIDKFLIAYFTNPGGQPTEFEKLFESFFAKFHLRPGLSREEEDRYVEANRLARRYIRKLSGVLQDPQRREDLLRRLRKFYRLDASEKISQIAA